MDGAAPLGRRSAAAIEQEVAPTSSPAKAARRSRGGKRQRRSRRRPDGGALLASGPGHLPVAAPAIAASNSAVYRLTPHMSDAFTKLQRSMEDAVELAERLLLVDFSADYQAPRSVQPVAAAGQSRPGSRSVTPPRAAVQAARDLCQRIGDAATSKKAMSAVASGPVPSHLVSLKLPTQLAAPPQQPQPNGTRTPTRCGSMTARDRYGSQAAAVAQSPVRPAGQAPAAAPTASPGFMTARGPRTSSSGASAHQLSMRASLDAALPLQQPSPARPAQQQQQQPTRSQARSSSHIPYGAAAAAANMLAQAIGAAKPSKPTGTPPRAPSGSAKFAAAAATGGPPVPSLLLSRLSGPQPGQASTGGGGGGGSVTVIGGALGSPLSPSRSAAAQTGSPLTSRQRSASSFTSSSITLAPHGSGALTARSPRTPSLLGLQAAVAGVTLPAEQPPLSSRPRYPAEVEADAAGSKSGKQQPGLQLPLPPREESAKELGGKQQPVVGGTGPRAIVPGLRLGSIAR